MQSQDIPANNVADWGYLFTGKCGTAKYSSRQTGDLDIRVCKGKLGGRQLTEDATFMTSCDHLPVIPRLPALDLPDLDNGDSEATATLEVA